MTADEKIIKLLEMQEEGHSIDEICKALELSSSRTLSNLANRKGYRFDKVLKKYVEKNGTVKPIVVEVEKEEKHESNTKSNTNKNNHLKLVLPSDLVSLWNEENETIKDIIRWYKKLKEDTKTDIFIDLPKSTNTMVSTRSNKDIWEQFGVFSEKHKKEFSKGDLLAQAIKEFIEKYS